MGLDVVELVMRVEEEFEIAIADEEASQLETVGQLHLCVLTKLGLTSPNPCLSSATFYQLRRAMLPLSGVARSDVRPTTPTELLLPASNRRAHWSELSQTLGAKLPALKRPRWMELSIKSGGFLVAASPLDLLPERVLILK